MKKSFILLIALLALPAISKAQCKGFAKKKCLPQLENFTPAENYNSLQMVEGEEAEINLVFVENNDYRIVVCTHPILGEVNFTIETETGQVVYNSADHEGGNVFDFSTTSTEKLKVLIRIPEPEGTTGMFHSGCVTVMIGHKPSS